MDQSDLQTSSVRDKSRGEYGCRHYRRRVRFITPCCGEEWWCRHCHNEAKYHQEDDWSKKHELDRKRISEVVCALCHTRQPVATSCNNCSASFGAYACTKCPFYDDDLSKETFHCDACGICRVGGRENFFHCNTCGSCYAANLRGNHVCVERAMHQNCPVCFEFLFESVDPTTVLRCGHTIHTQCLRDLEKNSASICPSCPICKKSLGDYSAYWKAIDREVASMPVPDEYRSWQTNILCNDCSTSCTVPYNMLAHKCTACGSYNTRRMGIITLNGSGEPVNTTNGLATPSGAMSPPANEPASAAVLEAMRNELGGWNEAVEEVWEDAYDGSSGGGDDDEEEEQEEQEEG